MFAPKGRNTRNHVFTRGVPLFMGDVKKIGDILKDFNPLKDKYISREFQKYGIYLAEELDDLEHKALYIKLAKEYPRVSLEKALSFVKFQDEGKVKSKARLFMWKLKKLGGFKRKKSDKSKSGD